MAELTTRAADSPGVVAHPPRSTVVNLGSLEKVPLGQGFCFVVGGEEVAVFRQRDGKLFASQNRCPHRQGPLAEGLLGAGKIICPLHAHKFDLVTGQGPDPKECLRTYPVREVKGDLLVDIGARLTVQEDCGMRIADRGLKPAEPPRS